MCASRDLAQLGLGCLLFMIHIVLLVPIFILHLIVPAGASTAIKGGKEEEPMDGSEMTNVVVKSEP